MKRLSIRWRLTLWYGIVLSAILAGFSVAVYAADATPPARPDRRRPGGGIGRPLRRRGALRGPADFPAGARPPVRQPRRLRVPGEHAAGRRSSSAATASARKGCPSPDRGAPARRPHQPHAGAPGACAPGVEAGRRARAGPSSSRSPSRSPPNDRALRELLPVLLLTGPLVVAGTLGGGYLLARKALAPVDRMAATAQEITSTRLDRRLTAPNPRDELGRLANTFNDMIARLQRSFEEIRRFTADAAHELRTPLASMRTEAEVALRAPRSPEQDGACSRTCSRRSTG